MTALLTLLGCGTTNLPAGALATPRTDDLWTETCLADVNHDGSVNLTDASYLPAQLNKTCDDVTETLGVQCMDLFPDDVVGLSDVQVFAVVKSTPSGTPSEVVAYCSSTVWPSADPNWSGDTGDTGGPADTGGTTDCSGSSLCIESVHGTTVDGGTWVLEGVGFGEKATAAPVLWDDLSAYGGYSDEDTFPTRTGAWGHPQDDDAPHMSVDSQYQYGEDTVLEDDFPRAPGRRVYKQTHDRGSRFEEIGTSDGDVLVADWWVYWTDAERHLHEIKVGRFWNEHNDAFGRISITGDYMVYNNSATVTTSSPSLSAHIIVDGEWNHYRVEVDNSGGLGPPGEGAGKIRVYHNNQLRLSVDDMSYRFDATDPHGEVTRWRTLETLDYNQTDAGIGLTYVSDIFMDDTFARVVLADSATWEDVVHYEIQPATAWADDSITVTYNSGSFSDGQTVYLYVSDEENNVSNPQGPFVVAR